VATTVAAVTVVVVATAVAAETTADLVHRVNHQKVFLEKEVDFSASFFFA